MAGNQLSNEVKTFIVQALACYDTPSTVAAAVKAEFGLVVIRQKVEQYDPNKRAASKLSKRWKDLFAETRKAFLEDTSRIGISHRAVRLRALDRMAAQAEAQRNLALAAQLHKQAAEEVGDAYTNRRELTGKGGAPIEARLTRIERVIVDPANPNPTGVPPAS